MPKRTPVESLYAELIRRGLPNVYARRTADEFADHRDDLIGDLKRQGLDDPESVAAARLGEIRGLADRIARDYRRRDWVGRHPIAVFVLAPIPMLALAAALFLASIQYGVDPLLGDALREWHTALSDWDRLVAGASICLLLYITLFVAMPAMISLVLSRLALTLGDLRWAVATSLLLALTAGAMDYHLHLAFEPNQSSFSLSGAPITANPVALLRHYANPAPLAQFASPMVMLGWVAASEWRRRRLVLAVASGEGSGGYAA